MILDEETARIIVKKELHSEETDSIRERLIKDEEFMEMLLKNTVEVERDDLKAGDLMVLNNKHAAMIYNFENPDKFYLIYASQKRQQVISFNSQNLVFELFPQIHVPICKRTVVIQASLLATSSI